MRYTIMRNGDGVGKAGSKPLPQPPPSAAAEIATGLFDKNKKEKIDAAKQAETLRQQAANQQALTSDRAREKKDSTTEEKKEHDLQRSQEQNLKGVKEVKDDAFLQRSSAPYQQREAGKTLTKQPQLVHQNVRGWSVKNSPQTPPQARTIILSNQRPAQNTKFVSQTGKEQLSTQPRTLNFQPTPKAQPQEVLKARENLILNYSNRPTSEPRKNPLLNARSFSSEKLSEKIQKLLQERFASIGQKFSKETSPHAVQIRDPLVFVKDKSQFRTFRLEKDGTLTELPSSDSGPHPLSPEAKLLLQKVLRRRGLQQDQQRASLKDEAKLKGEKTERDSAQKIQRDIAHQTETLDFETRFALILHEVLEEEKKLEKSLDGNDPHFPGKKDWQEFFARMLNTGNQEKQAKTSFDSLMSMIFRGLFKNRGEKNVMVGDFKFLQGGKRKEEKFAQLTIDDEELLALLSNLEPGQSITTEMLQKYLGDELSYLKLAHIAEKISQGAQADAAGKNVTFNPKGSIDLFSQARLERSLLNSRKENLKGSEQAGVESGLGGLGTYGKDGFFANTYEWLGLRERYRGKPKLYTLIAYLTIITLLGVTTAFFLLKAL